jgi:hypothetical protein
MELLRQSGGRSYYVADGTTRVECEDAVITLGSVKFVVDEASRAKATRLVAEFNARSTAAVAAASRASEAGGSATPQSRSHTLARAAQALAWILGAIGVISGLALAFRTDPSCEGSCSHPFVVNGILTMLLAVFFAVFGAMIASYIEFRTVPTE